MPTFDIKIRATVTKTYRVEADDQDRAEEEAHGLFSVLNEYDVPEDYEQDTVDVQLIEEECDAQI